jgi:DNA-binding NarL/FixJ family response regulator
VRVGLVYALTGVTLLVQDDGEGFDRSLLEEGGAEHGLGLGGMAERARLLGGTLELDSTPGWGTRIRAWIPSPSEVPDALDRRADPVRILVVDDHAVTRAGIARLLANSDPGLHVVGEAATGAEAFIEWRALRPDVVLMDLQMLDGDALMRSRGSGRMPRRASSRCRRSRVTSSPARSAPARAAIGKEASGMDLARAIRAAARGEVVVSGTAVERLYSHLNGSADVVAFTDREREVLRLLERGSTDREIAAALTISVKTVEKHVGSILRKLGAQNRTQAVALARERVAG